MSQSMCSIGTRIAELRKRRSITQEELGKALHISGQAVSKWENGGTPDAEIIPDIADFFGVSTDVIFGREGIDGNELSLEERIKRDLASLPFEERMERAYDLCWQISKGILQGKMNWDAFFNERIQHSMQSGEEIHEYLMLNSGANLVSVMERMHCYLLIPEPENGFRECIAEPESYRAFFSVMVKPYRLEILLHLYEEGSFNTLPGVTAEYIGEVFHLDEEETNQILSELSDAKLIRKNTVRKASGKEDFTYSGTANPYIFPFLFFTKNFMKGPDLSLVWWERKESLLNTHEDLKGTEGDEEKEE